MDDGGQVYLVLRRRSPWLLVGGGQCGCGGLVKGDFTALGVMSDDNVEDNQIKIKMILSEKKEASVSKGWRRVECTDRGIAGGRVLGADPACCVRRRQQEVGWGGGAWSCLLFADEASDATWATAIRAMGSHDTARKKALKRKVHCCSSQVPRELAHPALW